MASMGPVHRYFCKTYHIVGKFGKFGESYMIRQLKSSKLVLTMNNLLADLLIRQTFFHQRFEQSQFAKFSRYMVVDTVVSSRQ